MRLGTRGPFACEKGYSRVEIGTLGERVCTSNGEHGRGGDSVTTDLTHRLHCNAFVVSPSLNSPSIFSGIYYERLSAVNRR